MQIAEALGLQRKQTVAFVGAGGKTTLMFRLAGELVARGCRVVTSTTTRIAVRETLMPPACFACESADDMLAGLPPALKQARHVLAVGCVRPTSDRVDGLPYETLARIAALPEVDFLLVEADGSRERPFKAPGAHEPAVPDCATIIVLVVGLDVLGLPLNSDCVHRPEVVARLAGSPLDSQVTPDVVAAVLGHPEGGGKSVPPGATVVPFLNKADLLPQVTPAEAIAGRLLCPPRIDCVLIGAAAAADPVWQIVKRT